MKLSYIEINSSFTKEHRSAMADLVLKLFGGLIIRQKESSSCIEFIVAEDERTRRIMQALSDADCLYHREATQEDVDQW